MTAQGANNGDTIIEVQELKTYFYLDEGLLKAVDGVSFLIERGKTLGLVGESGCGKSITAQSILRIVPPPGVSQGSILYHRQDGGAEPSTRNLVELKPSGSEMRAIRGKDITMIFQEPMSSFSPLHTIGNQIMEAILTHHTSDKAEAQEITLDMLDKVGISNPRQRIDEYPHQFSGGMRQRAMIAMALSCRPSLLVADEPTTALDVTVQAQVMELMIGLQEEFGMAMLYITHDLGVIAELADRIAVMYLGKIVEFGTAVDIFYHARHPYTRALLESVPKMGEKSDKRLASIKGTVPVPIDVPDRCRFLTRCEHAMRACLSCEPSMIDTGEGHHVRCYLFERDRDDG